ncbi:hypothetical protein L1887_32877 [Cichorium endivia]|nr:hypothetical protein L1887_32877 [Cichorium endivia]
MAAAANYLKSVDFHNIPGYPMDPPEAHKKDFQSMINGLNNCRISHALRVNPVICKYLINDFWKGAAICKDGEDAATIKSTVQGVQIVISEQIIREVLKFGNKPGFPTEYPVYKVKYGLAELCYEGDCPPTLKIMLPPFRRFLAHTFVLCVSGRKERSDEINQVTIAAIVSLARDWEYNYSGYVFEEMQSNLQRMKKGLFLMYPRFLQEIFNQRYPQLRRTANQLDLKLLGPNTFVLMKQVRKNLDGYKGLRKLVEFGRFADSKEAPEAPVAPDSETEKVRASLVFGFEQVIDIVDDDEEREEEIQGEEYVELTAKELDDLIESAFGPLGNEKETETEVFQPSVLIPPQQDAAATIEKKEDEHIVVVNAELVEGESHDPTTNLVQKKRRTLDPHTGVYCPEIPKDISTSTHTPTEADPSPTVRVESIPVIHDVQSHIFQEQPSQDYPEIYSPMFDSNPMDLDDQGPIRETAYKPAAEEVVMRSLNFKQVEALPIHPRSIHQKART